MIRYLTIQKNSERTLGTELFQDIEEFLFFDPQNHPIFITKKFASRDEVRWKIENIIHRSKGHVDVHVKAAQHFHEHEFLSELMKHNRKILTRLKFGSLVEVEFGYIPKIKSTNGSAKPNKLHSNAVFDGEMHKRRLAIIISATKARIQVVPISSQRPVYEDKSVLELPKALFAKIIGYNAPHKDAFALCNMIQTVAPERILPPRLKESGTLVKRNVNFPSRLTSKTIPRLQEALSHSVNLPAWKKNKDDIDTLRKRLQEQNKNLEKLEEYCIKLIEDAYNIDTETAHSQFRDELASIAASTKQK